MGEQGWPLCHVMHVTVSFRTRRIFISSLLPACIFIGRHALHISNINKDKISSFVITGGVKLRFHVGSCSNVMISANLYSVFK